MKLVRVGPPGRERPGVLGAGGEVLDATSVTADYGPEFFASDGLSRLRERVDAVDGLPRMRTDGERVGAPVGRPYEVLCLGLNYADHAAESGMTLPEEPVVFNKLSNTIVGPFDDIVRPPHSERVDYEVELAVVLGAPAQYLPDLEAAAATIAGYAITNDVSERDYQLNRGGQWVKGKSCATFNPLGPWLVTADEVPDPHALAIELSVNGETRQASQTAEMVFAVPYVVWYLSQFFALEPGDLINTGTPPGVGMGWEPPRYLKAGDTVEATIEGLGTQRQRVVDLIP
ncbi:FAA hydrolase family protein [Egibacter rhizosphaerae]|uniref:FAA hydrolase family protein n=1 Tax=Egibacter rhizosphaerae TaxID=1670831 RepID=A0A411YJP7_9ACTN|nr:fumarylacetoacetate hydrolase family protein [Egibacter rhizosphaerae]QBI21419.1 FAA hydrolase family protein [Egibacter rhizosphaerae]